MTTMSTRVHGPADPDLVWRRYERPALWPTWAPHLTSVRASTATIEPGTTGTVVGLGVLRVRFVVDAVDAAARTWVWTVRCGPVRLRLEHDVVASGGGTRAGLRVTGPAPVVVAYLPTACWALRHLVRP